MNITTEDDRDALFAAWNADRHSNSPRPLAEWLSLYPDQAEEFVLWAADAPVLDCAEKASVVADAEARTIAIGRQVVAEMRARYGLAPLGSLTESARAKGLTPKTLAERLGVGMTIVAKLQQRLFQFASLPENLIDDLADALEVTSAQIRAYLQQSAALAHGASYKSKGVPTVAAQEDFRQAVRACREMTEEQQAHWLDAAR